MDRYYTYPPFSKGNFHIAIKENQCTAGSSCSTKALSITQSSFIIQHSYVGYGEGASHNVSWTAQGYVSKI